jgi:hypothetical protein
MQVNEPVNFNTHRMLAMYANGEQVADIGNEFGVTVNTIYKRMKEHPSEYKDAKDELAALRNAKYRRLGALAIDKQMTYLEEMGDDDISSEMTTIIKLGESAEKRADLNEGKATEITEHKGIQIVKFNEIKKPDDDSE